LSAVDVFGPVHGGGVVGLGIIAVAPALEADMDQPEDHGQDDEQVADGGSPGMSSFLVPREGEERRRSANRFDETIRPTISGLPRRVKASTARISRRSTNRFDKLVDPPVRDGRNLRQAACRRRVACDQS